MDLQQDSRGLFIACIYCIEFHDRKDIFFREENACMLASTLIGPPHLCPEHQHLSNNVSGITRPVRRLTE